MNVVYFKPISDSINQKKVLDDGRRTADADADGGRRIDGGRGRGRMDGRFVNIRLFRPSIRPLTRLFIRTAVQFRP